MAFFPVSRKSTITLVTESLRLEIEVSKGGRQLTCDLDMGNPKPTVLVLIIEKFILWEDVIVAWDEPIRSKRSEEFEAAGGGPKAG